MTTGMTSGKGEVWTRSGLARSDCSAGNRLTWCDAKLVRRSSGSGTASVPAEMMVTFKEEVSRMLTPHASAIVPDPEYGLPAAKQRAKPAGLLLAYEQTGYDKHVRGRMPRLLEGWTAQRLFEVGADSVKLLLYYSTLSSVGINEAKHEFVKRLTAEIRGSRRAVLSGVG